MEFKKIKINDKQFIYYLKFPLEKKTLIVLKGKRGYIMCGYLNLNTANKFKEVAIKIVGVSNLNEALKAKVHSLSKQAKKIGIYKGQAIKNVLKIIA